MKISIGEVGTAQIVLLIVSMGLLLLTVYSYSHNEEMFVAIGRAFVAVLSVFLLSIVLHPPITVRIES